MRLKCPECGSVFESSVEYSEADAIRDLMSNGAEESRVREEVTKRIDAGIWKFPHYQCPIDGSFHRLDDYEIIEYTPERITTLNPNEIFVFGSNLNGFHGGGAARVAMENFGAVWGQGVGMQGQSYAIPTMHGGAEEIKPYVDEFILYAKKHPELKFLVTRIGCGIAGFKDEQMAPLFKLAIPIANIILPESFCK